MTSLMNAVVDRLARLTSVLVDLKQRVRLAVATELGKAMGDAVRDLVSAIVRHCPGSPLEPESRVPHPPNERSRPHDPWDDDPEDNGNELEAEDEYSRRSGSFDDPGIENRPTVTPPSSHWASALTLGASVTRWVVARRGPTWVGALAGGLVLVGSLASGPVLGAIVSVVHVATELMHLGRLTPPSV